MNDKQGFWRAFAEFLMVHTPIGSYGELVLRPVTMAETAAPRRSARHAGHHKP